MRPALSFGARRFVDALTPEELDEIQIFAESGEGQIPRNVVLSLIAEVRTARMERAQPDTVPSNMWLQIVAGVSTGDGTARVKLEDPSTRKTWMVNGPSKAFPMLWWIRRVDSGLSAETMIFEAAVSVPDRS